MSQPSATGGIITDEQVGSGGVPVITPEGFVHQIDPDVDVVNP